MKKIQAATLTSLLCLSVPTAASDRPTFHEACAFGDAVCVREHLADGANPNESDERGRSPLFYTVRAGVEAPLSSHLKIVEMLAAAGARLDAPSETSVSARDALPPLHATLEKGAAFEELTGLLLHLGASPNLPAGGATPLHLAAQEAASDLQMRLLLESGADATAKDAQGQGPLSVLVSSPAPSLEKARLLLDSGADPNETHDAGGDRGLTALMIAAKNAPSDLVRLLLSRGALLRLADSSGRTAFDHAVSADRKDNAALLR